jgi:hypothetical protein
MRWLFKLLRLRGDARALSRGPDAYGRRVVRRRVNRVFNRALRRVVRP